MTDEEVGELWAKAKLPAVRDLIVKLVKERARAMRAEHECRCGYYQTVGKCPDHHMTDSIEDALRTYGIDPATWPKEGA